MTGCPRLEIQRDLAHVVCRIEIRARRGVIVAACVIQKLLDGDRVAARIGRIRKAEKRINLCIRFQLLGVVKSLNRRREEHLAAARQQKAVRWLCNTIACFGPCIGAGEFGDAILGDRQLCRADSVGLHERLHRVVEPREGRNCSARYRPLPVQRDILFGENCRVTGVNTRPAALDADRVEAARHFGDRIRSGNPPNVIPCRATQAPTTSSLNTEQ